MSETQREEKISVPANGRPVTKNIVVFSDGTSNSNTKPFKTNVWRMYKAVDLGKNDIGTSQITFYDEGVGNSAIRPLAMLGAVFGFGVKTNVLDLYRFICRNYRPGDDIFAFGFSRGAFTIRSLVGLINKQGLITYDHSVGIDEADLARRSEDAYRAYIRWNIAWMPPMVLLLPAWRLLREALITVKRRLLGQQMHQAAPPPPIAFVGVWDTVAAYGGPIQEIVRGIDMWVRPLTFKNRKLPACVDRARHALALDDERDAFQPVLWDEPRTVDRARLQQVWFTGMHADVGGGYPDDHLAHVSLTWMMNEASKAGLRLRPDRVEAAARTADAFGPMHDSRAGVGVYYRYQPRLVGAFLEPPEKGKESEGDPDKADKSLTAVLVDRSVVHRILSGTDGYAPITLPEHFEIVGEASNRPELPADVEANLRRTTGPRYQQQENLRDWVWVRRLFYFATLAATLALVLMPFWPDRITEPFCLDDRCVLGAPFEALAEGSLSSFVPGFLAPWWTAFAALPSYALGLLIAIIVLNIFSSATEQHLRARTRRLWREAVAGHVAHVRRSPLRTIRTSPPYQGVLWFLKTYIFPTFFGVLILAFLIWLASIAVTQLRLAYGEPRGLFACEAPETQPTGAVRLRIDSPCTTIGKVKAGETYLIELRPDPIWRDGAEQVGKRNETYPPAPETLGLGLPHSQLGVVGWLGTPLRRVLDARYLEPLALLRPSQSARTSDIYINRLGAVRCGDGVWRALAKPRHSGSLALTVNEAVPPVGRADLLYRGWTRAANEGGAAVTLREVGPGRACDHPPPTP